MENGNKALEAWVQRLDNRFEELAKTVAKQNGLLPEIKENIRILDGKIDRLASSLASLSAEMREHRTRLDAHIEETQRDEAQAHYWEKREVELKRLVWQRKAVIVAIITGFAGLMTALIHLAVAVAR